MGESTSKAINAGVAAVVAVIMAIVGLGIVSSASTATVLDIDTTQEWQDNAQSQSTGLLIDNDSIQIDSASTETFAEYESLQHDNVTSYTVNVSEYDDTVNNVTLDAGANNYELTQGVQTVELSNEVDSFRFELERTSDTDPSPVVSSVEATAEDSGMLGLVAAPAFGLLVLLVVVSTFDVGGLSRRV